LYHRPRRSDIENTTRQDELTANEVDAEGNILAADNADPPP
jgi:hypothetical protein